MTQEKSWTKLAKTLRFGLYLGLLNWLLNLPLILVFAILEPADFSHKFWSYISLALIISVVGGMVLCLAVFVFIHVGKKEVPEFITWLPEAVSSALKKIF